VLFTQHQVNQLEHLFGVKKYLSATERDQLAAQIGLRSNQVSWRTNLYFLIFQHHSGEDLVPKPSVQDEAPGPGAEDGAANQWRAGRRGDKQKRAGEQQQSAADERRWRSATTPTDGEHVANEHGQASARLI